MSALKPTRHSAGRTEAIAACPCCIAASWGCAFYLTAEEVVQPSGMIPGLDTTKITGLSAEWTREEVIAISQDNDNLVVEMEMKTKIQLLGYY